MRNELKEAPHSVVANKIVVLNAWTNGITDGFILVRQSNAVVWGVIEGGKPTFGPGYDESLVQEARAFNASAEICIYRDGGSWVRRTITKGGTSYSHALTRTYPLWGTSKTDPKDGFRIWTEGSRGIRQTLPAGFTTPVLEVVHLYREDPDTGAIYEAGFRLSNLIEAR